MGLPSSPSFKGLIAAEAAVAMHACKVIENKQYSRRGPLLGGFRLFWEPFRRVSVSPGLDADGQG
jgi:hypothetical protein